jgi:dipeptidyl aminopeptidase/acylaminoacyl peptidase
MLEDLALDGTIAIVRKMDDPTSVWATDPVARGEARRLASATTGDSPSISPDAKLVRYLDFVNIDGRIHSRTVVIPSAGGPPVARFVLPPGATRTIWSADSASVTYVDRNQGWNLMRQPIAGGAPSPLTHFTDGFTSDFAWSRDGARIAVSRRIGQKSGLWSVPIGRGEPKLLAEFRGGFIGGCAFTPDSNRVVFTYETSSKEVVLISDFQ